MAIYNREDPRTALPQLEKMIEELRAKTDGNHLEIGGIHICWGTETISLATANTYQETSVDLPYKYTSAPTCIASFSNRTAAARTAYCTPQTDNQSLDVGVSGTTVRDYYIHWLTIGI